ncbi:MAG TPA: tRNA lysidine(34) synthetase TilS [Candidatus Sulfotelmatobacter sp.]|nr:tRNA lysidine(34) synthetase TilS [Candidatus Sulfotelmatobacter sp.]
MLTSETAEPLVEQLKRSPLLRARGRMLVAVSGGPDSTALLLAAHEAGLDVVAAHYDHALRPGSELVGRQVETLCTELGVELVIERRTDPMPAGSVQAGARSLRYAFLERASSARAAQMVLLAHTADDVVEGMVLHMLRGCGLGGFRGMPARRGPYVRPWLSVWRAEVSDFLRRRQVVAYEDPANIDPRHARVRVRLQVLPGLERDRPGIVKRFHAAALRASELHAQVVERAEAALAAGPLTAEVVAGMPEPVAMETLALLYRRAGGPEPGLSRAQLAAMLSLARGGRGGRGADLPRGLRFRIVGSLIQVIRTASERAPKAQAEPRLETTACAGCGDAGAVHLREGLELRIGHRSPGLRMRPVGGRGTRKLQDIFVDSLVPREDRDSWPLVFAGSRLAWVPGIAVDSDHASAPGRRALHVSMVPMPVRSSYKVGSLETPKSPRGESS